MTEIGKVLYRAAYVGPDGEGELKEVEYGTVEEALLSACRDLAAGYRPIGVWAPDRSLLHSAADIRARCGGTASRVDARRVKVAGKTS